MGKIRRSFTLEFKQAVVAQVLTGQLSASQASREYQITLGMIHRWKQQAQLGTLHGSSAKRERGLERENRMLKEKLAELYLEVALLKKVRQVNLQHKNEPYSVYTASSLPLSKEGAK